MKNPEISVRDLGKWMKDFLQEIIMFKTVEKGEHERLDPDYLCYGGFSPQSITRAQRERIRKGNDVGFDTRKRPAQAMLERSKEKHKFN